MNASTNVRLCEVASRYPSSSSARNRCARYARENDRHARHGQPVLHGPRIVEVARVPDVEPVARHPELAVPRDPRRQHRVEQVHASMDRFEQVERRSQSHQVPRPPVARQQRHRDIERSSALRRGLVAGEPADVDPVERQRSDELGRCGAQVRLQPALDRRRTAPDRAAGVRPASVRPSDGFAPSPPPRPPAATRASPAGRTRPRRRAPSASWTAIACSGVNRCSEPSRCERKVTPSSSTTRRSPSETTWKPPESVRIGRSHAMNRCRPPRRATRSWPGRRYRW